MVPRIQRQYGADLVHAIVREDTSTQSESGIARIRMKGPSAHMASRWISVGSTTLAEPIDSNYSKYQAYRILAHEIGHNLGLHHDRHTLINNSNPGSGGQYPNSKIFHHTGYGYGTFDHDGIYVGTIMSYSFNYDIPLFSSADELTWSALCGDNNSIDNVLGVGFCPSFEGQFNLSDSISIGGHDGEYGVTVDASEALQYAIEDASNYSESGRSAVVQDNLD